MGSSACETFNGVTSMSVASNSSATHCMPSSARARFDSVSGATWLCRMPERPMTTTTRAVIVATIATVVVLCDSQSSSSAIKSIAYTTAIQWTIIGYS